MPNGDEWPTKPANSSYHDRRGFCSHHHYVEKMVEILHKKTKWMEGELGGRVTMRLFLALVSGLAIVLLSIGGMQWSIKDDIGIVKADMAIVKTKLTHQKEDIEDLDEKIENFHKLNHVIKLPKYQGSKATGEP
jgi:hypothetical protein